MTLTVTVTVTVTMRMQTKPQNPKKAGYWPNIIRRAVCAPIRYRDQETGAMLANIERMNINDAYIQAEIAGAAVNTRAWEAVMSPAETKFIKAVDDIDGTDFRDEDPNEYAAVGAGLGGGFTNTAELRPMKYNEALHAGPDQKNGKRSSTKSITN
jgi:hypothetical protein